MRNRIVEALLDPKMYLPMDLQLFADDDGDSGEQGAGGDPGEDQGPEGDQEQAGKSYSQDEVNQLIEKRLARERSKLKAEAEQAVKDAKDEATKLAKMNADQKREYEAQKKDETIKKQQEEIDRLKADAMKAELGKQVSAELVTDGYPGTADVLEFIVGKDAEETKARKDRFVSIINADRKAQELKRATGSTPKSYGSGENIDAHAERIKKYKERYGK